MALAKNYFASAIPEPWQILGVKLRPFSLGHYIKLSRLGCAFVSETETDATLQDLVLGCVVCSMPTTVDQTKDPFWGWLQRGNGGWRYSAYKLWRKLLRKKCATPAEYDVYLWGKRAGKFDLSEKVKLFSQYMDACSVVPPYVEERQEGNSRVSGAHWTQSVINALVSKCNYTLEEALNVPISLALADFLKHAESEGAVRILPDEVAQ